MGEKLQERLKEVIKVNTDQVNDEMLKSGGGAGATTFVGEDGTTGKDGEATANPVLTAENLFEKNL